MPQFIDLHMHTVNSDGHLTTSELVDIVRAKDLAAFAITDHDALDGYFESQEILNPDDPELISGVELSVAVEGQDLHMLAYLFDAKDDEFNSALASFQQERNQRGERIVSILNEIGVPLSFASVEEAANGSAIGRPHVAQALVNDGLVRSFEAAFQKYIGNNCPAYVPKSKMAPGEAIDLIHRAGGLAMMAHPYINGMVTQVEALCQVGLDGIEVFHYSHSNEQVRKLKQLAKRLNLAMSGGSDFHGRTDREGEVGSQPVPVDFLESLKTRAEMMR